MDTNEKAHVKLINTFEVDPITALIGDEIEDSTGAKHLTKDIVQGIQIAHYV